MRTALRHILFFPIGVMLACASCLSPAGPSGGAVSPAPFAASAAPTPENSDDHSAGDPSATTPPPTPPGATASDSPITVVGTPMGSTPIPDCLPGGTKLYFDDALTAITGKTDDLGRREILVKTAVHLQVPNEPPGTSDNRVSFGSADSPYQYYGSTAPWNGCVFAKIYAPAEAAGRIVRLSTSVFICAPEMPDAAVPQGATVAALSLRTWSPLEAFSDVTIPAETVETSLDDCGGTSNPWKDSVLRPKF